MPTHPLLTDNTIALSATLAATLGLNEAVLLTVLNDAARLQQTTWAKLSKTSLRQRVPFWNDDQIRDVLQSLINQGMLTLSGPMFPQAEGIVFSFHAPTPASAPSARAQKSVSYNPPLAVMPVHVGHVKEPIHAQWQPSNDALARLAQHGISQEFALAQRDEFLLKGVEEGANRNDWNQRFFSFVKRKAEFAKNDAEKQRRQLERFHPVQEEAKPISLDWQPQPDALQILQRAGIDPQFIADAVPEFVLYWAERGDAHKTWNSKFVQHVRQQWARFASSLEYSTQPTRLAENWKPSDDCFDILAMAHIDRGFAEQLLPEFVLYWRDSNQMHNSWNSRFLQYVKQSWGKRLAQSSAGGAYGNQQTVAQPDYATAQASIERLKDTSW